MFYPFNRVVVSNSFLAAVVQQRSSTSQRLTDFVLALLIYIPFNHALTPRAKIEMTNSRRC